MSTNNNNNPNTQPALLKLGTTQKFNFYYPEFISFEQLVTLMDKKCILSLVNIELKKVSKNRAQARVLPYSKYIPDGRVYFLAQEAAELPKKLSQPLSTKSLMQCYNKAKLQDNKQLSEELLNLIKANIEEELEALRKSKII